MTQFIEGFSESLQKQGYMNHVLKTKQKNDSLTIGTLQLNEKTRNITLFFEKNIELPNYIENNKMDIEFSKLDETIKKLYSFYETKGHPFTQIKLANLNSVNDTLIAQVQITTSKQRFINKVIIKGYNSFPKKYIKNYLFINKKTQFNKKTVETTSSAIKTLDFVSETRKPEILFTNDSTQLYIYLKKINSNKFDGLVGFTNDTGGKLRFSGYFDIRLNNNLNYGEEFSFYWSDNGNNQEHFKLKAKTPYILNSPISPSIDFKIYKQDSSFTTRDLLLNLEYDLTRKNRFSINMLSKNSTNLNDVSNNIETYSKKLYGASYTYRTNNNDAAKIKLNIATSFGNKKTEKTKQKQQYAFLDISILEKLTNKSIIFIHNRTESLFGNNLVENEFFQIGGANTIRGFYEESIFTPSYSFTNLEYRLLTSVESYLYTFTDIGVAKNNESETNDRLYSFGLGYAYKTKSGFINFNYAFGKINKTPFDFNRGIFHIKLTTNF